MATMNHLTHDRVEEIDFFVRLCRVTDRIPRRRTTLSAVWERDYHGRLACHWEFDFEGRFIPSG